MRITKVALNKPVEIKFNPSHAAMIMDGLRNHKPSLSIERVKFSGRATIVFWSDGDKTVVKDVDRRDVEHDTKLQWSGLALAICKKMYGDNFKPMFSAIETAIEKETD